MNEKYTYEYVCDFVQNESKCKIISTSYINNSKKMTFLCDCGNEFSTSFYQFKHKNKRQCNDCGKILRANHHRLSYKEVKSYIESVSNSKLLSDSYVNNATELKLKCECKNVYYVNFAKFKSEKRYKCPSCKQHESTLRQRYDFSYVKHTINKKYSNTVESQYFLLSNKYERCEDALDLIDTCGYKYHTAFKNILNNIKNRRALQKFGKVNKYTCYNINNWLKLNNIDLVLLSTKFLGSHNYMEWECSNGHIFKRTWNEVLCGARCSICTFSKGETRILELLKLNNIDFNTQYQFDNLFSPKSNRNLRFDFAIFNNNKLNYLIEYDGQYHFKEVTTIKDPQKRKEEWERTQLYDKIKDDYCKENNINLIRIPYWDYKNIPDILEKHNIITIKS